MFRQNVYGSGALDWPTHMSLHHIYQQERFLKGFFYFQQHFPGRGPE